MYTVHMFLVLQIAPALLPWAWLLALFMSLWLCWTLYKFIKLLDYLGGMKWTVLQIRLPEDAEETPKAMENAIALWGGVHKAPDLFEQYFEGYVEWWYSLEVQCEADRVRYYMFIPEVFRQFFEGVIYGQYPTAEIREAADYALRFDPLRVREDFEVYGTDIILVKDDVYPIRTYTQYDDPLSPQDTFIDPHQALIEAYSNIKPGEQYWFQVIVWPTDHRKMAKWIAKGEKEIARITGRSKTLGEGFFKKFFSFFISLPRDMVNLATGGRLGPGAPATGGSDIHFFDPVETAKMEGILRKISREAYPTRVRVMYLAPKGQLHKPNVGRALGGFRQFNTFHLNSFKPDPKTKSNGVDYIMKERRRRYRERAILAEYRWRDPYGTGGMGPPMMTAEEIATLYHFPAKWVKAPVLERTKAGTYSAPDNVPYV